MKSEKTVDMLLNLATRRESKPFSRVIQAKPHSAAYMMHKFWARRPHNVFAELVNHYSETGDIILDPFCGGGVTVVEALRLGRKVVGVDLNPLATYVTGMEVRPLDVEKFLQELNGIRKKVEVELSNLYQTSCPKCQSKSAMFDWLEWSDGEPKRMKYVCQNCGTGKKEADEEDFSLVKRIDGDFERIVAERKLWYPKATIPKGDKTEGIIKRGYTHFWQLFTKRNLLALSLLYNAISAVSDSDVRDFLRFAFSSSLKWASMQSHLRGNIVEGWAMHAYWLYPKTLEINVWKTFCRRCAAVARGKEYTNKNIGNYYNRAESSEDLLDAKATCLVLTQSSTNLPVEEDTVDLVLTDPPYGGNVNYAELADYWMVWLNKDQLIEKTEEIIVNKNQKKGLSDYEQGLTRVFSECYRVLKKDKNLVATFNSRNLHVVSSFVIAATRAGFVLHPQGLLYQPPIKAYTTTFHGIFVGAFIGDFIFTFCKPSSPTENITPTERELENFKEHIDSLINNYMTKRIIEPELREKAYKVLIPFLSSTARANLSESRKAVEYFESRMKSLEPHFRKLRKQIVEKRRKVFLSRQNRSLDKS
jgi:16S rRNA G966 N2-methylase RsmD